MMEIVQEQLSKEKAREIIARRGAKEFNEGDTVTLGIGLPTEIVKYVPKSLNVMFHSENGFMGVGPNLEDSKLDPRVIDAGGNCVQFVKGAAFYDSLMAFTLMRGGHLDVTVLGALQVDEEGSIANWLIPGKFSPGMGGAMDLIIGAKKVIVAMEHTSKGRSKIVKKCTLPVTAKGEVNVIITEKCVFRVTKSGLLLEEINPMFSVNDIKMSTDADFTVSPDLKTMEI